MIVEHNIHDAITQKSSEMKKSVLQNNEFLRRKYEGKLKREKAISYAQTIKKPKFPLDDVEIFESSRPERYGFY